jgi:hypothetical protein
MSDIVVEEVIQTVEVVEDSITVDVIDEVVSVIEVAQQGPTGPSGSGDKTFVQPFTVASSVTVIHSLGKHPSVTVVDSAGDEVEGTVSHDSDSQLTVSFSNPFSGVVYCN